MKLFKYDTSAEAYRGIIETFLTNQEGVVEGCSGLRVWSRNFIIQIKKPDIDISLDKVGFTQKRWSTFLANYFDPMDFSVFYQRTVHASKSQTPGYTCPVKAPHTMGNCLIGLSTQVKPLQVTLHSRACVWAPTGLLDLSFASLLALRLQQDMQTPSATVFWHIDQMQLNVIKCLPIFEALGMMPDIAAGKYNYSPFGALCYKEYYKLEKTINSPYKTYKRYATKALQLASDTPPPVAVIDLPKNFRYDAIEKLPGKYTIVEIAEQLGANVKEAQFSARMMGLAFQEKLNITWSIDDPQIQRFINILKHRQNLRGVGG